MYRLEKQIIEMENFASHLEEVFITVEVSLAGMCGFSRGWGLLAPPLPSYSPGGVGAAPQGTDLLQHLPAEPCALGAEAASSASFCPQSCCKAALCLARAAADEAPQDPRPVLDYCSFPQLFLIRSVSSRVCPQTRRRPRCAQ